MAAVEYHEARRLKDQGYTLEQICKKLGWTDGKLRHLLYGRGRTDAVMSDFKSKVVKVLECTFLDDGQKLTLLRDLVA